MRLKNACDRSYVRPFVPSCSCNGTAHPMIMKIGASGYNKIYMRACGQSFMFVCVWDCVCLCVYVSVRYRRETLNARMKKIENRKHRKMKNGGKSIVNAFQRIGKTTTAKEYSPPNIG